MRRALAIALAAAAASPASALAAFPATPPNDPHFDASPLPNATNEQWDLASPAGGFDRGISVDRAWPLSTGAGVFIADIDVGVDLDHPDLAGRWLVNGGETGRDVAGADRRTNGRDDDRNGFVDDWRGYDFFGRDPNVTSETRNAHGTNVAGVLGAATDNGIGIAGIAPGAYILPIRTADNILHGSSRLAEGIVYAADRGARVVSMSVGTDSIGGQLRRAVAYAHRRGAVMVAPIGNEFHFHHEYPATFDEVIAVGGVNPDSANTTALSGSLALVGLDFKVRAHYSDFGPHIELAAPTQVPTTQWGGGYIFNWSGASATAPHVAGVAALVLARARAQGLRLGPGEVRQLLRATADDLTSRVQGFRPGWDRMSGWGRVNALHAVERARAGRIPPDTNITAPAWYASKRDRFTVRGLVRGRSPARWTLELGDGEEPRAWRRIATGRTTPRRGAALATVEPRALDDGGHTLRLRSIDSNGNEGEDRAFFFAARDPSLRRGYPRDLGTSGEASPVLADVAGDRAQEIVLATSVGRVNVLSGRTGRPLSGWPRTMRTGGVTAVRRRIGPYASGFLGTPAVGNLAGGPAPEIVAAGVDGRVYAWSARGRPVPGFPVRIDLHRPGTDGKLDPAIYASPALADLDRDGRLDIVVGAADQRVYAWDGRGRRLPGWPVLARDGRDGDVAKILSSPAVGDLDGDGSPDVVEGTAEVYGGTPASSGRVHAWDARGRPKRGWPVEPAGLSADSIPLAGEGVPASPVLADVDGDGRDEVAITAFTGQPQLYRGDGTRLHPRLGGPHFDTLGRGARSRAGPGVAATLSIGANGAFGRTRPGKPLRYFSGLIDARLAVAQVTPASRIGFEHLFGGWDARTGRWLPGFPAPVEGWTIVAGTAVADVGGDSDAEAIAGSSGYLLHAFGEDGREPRGWPKQTGGWLVAGPAAGDVDGDGRTEVVAVTREGWLFVWDTPAPARRAEWPMFRHDPRNSGRYR
jgi:hypothetical protein